MKISKALPALAAALCLPGIVLRALHLLNGFDIDTGLPAVGNRWVWFCIVLFAACAVLYAVLALPLRGWRKEPFEQLLGTESPLFRMVAVIAGLLMAAGGVFYLYLALTSPEEDAAAWARILELVYAVGTLLAGGCSIGLAGAQGGRITAGAAKLTLVPLLWGCVHLLITYRMTCTDPKLPSFAFGLVADVLLVLSFYHLARLLYGKPRPEKLAFFSALALTMSLSDFGGYGLAWLMGARAANWPAKMVLRSGLSAAACLLLLAELSVLVTSGTEDEIGN